MEPADIDWKRVVSNFVRDDAYENINAPRWLDLADAAAGGAASQVDDVAFFCRPDCRHPKTFEDFQRSEAQSPKSKLLRSSSERLPFGERSNTQRDQNNVKRRAGAAPFFHPSSPLKPKATKKYREDLENQAPNQSTPPPRHDRSKLGAQNNIAKEAIKSSAEKKVEEDEWQQKRPPRLRSTMSARNLFSGRDILSQISEFCHELKKIAAGFGKPSSPEQGVKKEQDIFPKAAAQPPQAEDREPLTPKKDSGSVKKSKMQVRLEIEKCKKNGLEVRAFPPTPQRFPSPSTHGLKKNFKSAVDAKSPLNKPIKSSSREKENKEEINGLLLDTNSEQGSSADIFWFFKPCAYMVE